MPKVVRVALLSALLWLVPSSVAHAASYLDEAVQALQTGYVYVSAEVSDVDSATKQQLEQQAGNSHVAVAILPSTAATEAENPAQFVQEVARRTGKDTVVVSFGGDLEAGSYVLSRGVASEIANEAEAQNNSVGDAVLDFIAEVKSVQSQTHSQQPTADTGGSIGFVVIALIVVLVAAVIAVILKLRHRAIGAAHIPERSKAPGPIQELLTEIRKLASGINDQQVLNKLNEGERHTNQLFARLIQARSNQIEEITARYKGTLQVVRSTLVQYQDIQNYPEYYQPKTQQYLADGREAIEQYAAGALKNVSEVAQGTLTDFRVNVKILAASNPAQDPKF